MVRDGTHPTLQQHHSTANVVLREEAKMFLWLCLLFPIT
jgi:hypothetical protein